MASSKRLIVCMDGTSAAEDLQGNLSDCALRDKPAR